MKKIIAEKHTVDVYNCTAFYKSEAKIYDKRRFMCSCSKFQDELFKATVFHLLSNNKEKPILDAGTGTGRFAIYFAERGRTVVAMDYSVEMLNEAKIKIQQKGLQDKIFLVQGDIQNLPFRPEVFSAINSIHVLVHFPTIDKIIAELSRVLKTGGIFVTEISNRFLSKTYYYVRKAIVGSPFSYPDHYRTLAELKTIASDNDLYVSKTKGIKKVPRILVHYLTCVLGYKIFLRKFAELEKYNFGIVKIVKIVKVRRN